MKTKLILMMLATGMASVAIAQQNTSLNKAAKVERTPLTPEKAAEHQANKAAKALSLSPEQKAQFQSFSLTRINAVKPLREKQKSETNAEVKKATHAEIQAQFKAFDTSVNGILTTDQKVKWEEHKKAMKEKRDAKKDEKVPFED